MHERNSNSANASVRRDESEVEFRGVRFTRQADGRLVYAGDTSAPVDATPAVVSYEEPQPDEYEYDDVQEDDYEQVAPHRRGLAKRLGKGVLKISAGAVLLVGSAWGVDEAGTYVGTFGQEHVSLAEFGQDATELITDVIGNGGE